VNIKPTARYKVMQEAKGRCYQFFCDLSGAHACTTKPYCAESPEKELEIAWETEGKAYFNKCRSCGRFVSAVMYNADVMECVECAPWENIPNYCPKCGTRLMTSKKKVVQKCCPECGAFLRYEGR